MKRLLAILLAAFTLLSLTACGEDENFPLTVGQIRLEKAPEAVVVLNAQAADVMLTLGYSGTIVGRSDECVQPSLESTQSVGAAASPDISAITALNADTLIADETLDPIYLGMLRDTDINVFMLDMPKSEDDIEKFYRTVGLIMGGSDAGAKNAAQEYSALNKNISDAVQLIGADNSYVICYLSLDDEGNFAIPEKDSFEDKLMRATGSVTVTQNEDEEIEKTLKIRDPDYIFYDSQAVLDKLGGDPELANLSAIAQGNYYQIPLDRLGLVGISAALNVGEIMRFMFPNIDAPTPDNSDAPNTSEPAEGSDVPNTSENSNPPSVGNSAEDYGLTITEGMVIDENSDETQIRALQQRFYDLGYSPSEPDGVFGNATQQYINDFQFLNNFVVDGIADYDFLTALFSADAIPRNN